VRFHTLQSVWASTAMSRRLSEGVIPSGAFPGGAAQPPDGMIEPFCSDPEMDRRIRFLHCMARTEGRCVQSHIDSYLAAVGYLLQSPSDAAFARMMVMSPADSPQEGALPDLGFMLRVVMMQTFTEVRRVERPVMAGGRRSASPTVVSGRGLLLLRVGCPKTFVPWRGVAERRLVVASGLRCIGLTPRPLGSGRMTSACR
jgi:hypothetical protein